MDIVRFPFPLTTKSTDSLTIVTIWMSRYLSAHAQSTCQPIVDHLPGPKIWMWIRLKKHDMLFSLAFFENIL